MITLWVKKIWKRKRQGHGVKDKTTTYLSQSLRSLSKPFSTRLVNQHLSLSLSLFLFSLTLPYFVSKPLTITIIIMVIISCLPMKLLSDLSTFINPSLVQISEQLIQWGSQKGAVVKRTSSERGCGHQKKMRNWWSTW